MNNSILISLFVLFFCRSNAYPMNFNSSYDSLDVLCKDIDNAGNCAKTIEENQIHKYVSLVKRINSDSISIKLSSGKILFLYNRSDPDGDNYYYFRDYLESIGYLLFRVQLIEGNYYLLVNLINGKKIKIDDIPIVSPDNKWLFTCSEDLAAEYNPNKLDIYKIANDSLSLFQTYNEATSDGHWIDPKNFNFKTNYQTSNPSNNIKVNYKAMFRKEKWLFKKQ